MLPSPADAKMKQKTFQREINANSIFMSSMNFQVDVNLKKSLRKSNKKPPKARGFVSTDYCGICINKFL